LSRDKDLTQLAQIASTYPSRERFLTELTLDPPDATSDQAGWPLLAFISRTVARSRVDRQRSRFERLRWF
jgi:hypothetical protein